jgi:hypothetical protein
MRADAALLHRHFSGVWWRMASATETSPSCQLLRTNLKFYRRPIPDSLALPAEVSALCEEKFDELAGAAANLSTDPDLSSWLERTFASNAATRFALVEASMLCRTLDTDLRLPERSRGWRQLSASPNTRPAVIQWRSIQALDVRWDTAVVETEGACSPCSFRA